MTPTLYLLYFLLTALSLHALYRCVSAPPPGSAVLEWPRWLLWCLTALSLLGTSVAWLTRNEIWLAVGLCAALLAHLHLRSRIVFDAEGFSLLTLFRTRRFRYQEITSISSRYTGNISRCILRVGWHIRPLTRSGDKRSRFLQLADLAYRQAHSGHSIPGWHKRPRRRKSSRTRDAFLLALLLFLLFAGMSVHAGYPLSEASLETFTAELRHVNDTGGTRLSVDFGMEDVHSIYKTSNSEALLAGEYCQPFTVQVRGNLVASLTDADGVSYMTLAECNTARQHTLGEGLLMGLGLSVFVFVIIACTKPASRAMIR